MAVSVACRFRLANVVAALKKIEVILVQCYKAQYKKWNVYFLILPVVLAAPATVVSVALATVIPVAPETIVPVALATVVPVAPVIVVPVAPAIVVPVALATVDPFAPATVEVKGGFQIEKLVICNNFYDLAKDTFT